MSSRPALAASMFCVCTYLINLSLILIEVRKAATKARFHYGDSNNIGEKPIQPVSDLHVFYYYFAVEL